MAGLAAGHGDAEPEYLHEAFDALAALHGQRPAVEDEQGASWTYAEVRDRSRLAAWRLQKLAAHSGGCNGPLPAVAVLSRRNCSWVAACLAVSRLGAPLLALSADLGSEVEADRNRDAVAEHSCRVLVLDGAVRDTAAAAPALAASALAIVDMDELLSTDLAGETEPNLPMLPRGGLDKALYLCYTGGTTSASKCCSVTHRMALHELATYPQIAPVKCTDRVLHQSSAYWGATSLGIFNVAWPFGACLVLAENSAGPTQVAAVVQRCKISVAGLVPSVLEALDEAQCDCLRVVFTWGEALQQRTIDRWASRVALLDLLIATEYWLILFADHRRTGADGSRASGFRPVPNARLTLMPPTDFEGVEAGGATAAAAGSGPVQGYEVGELFMAGPMVSALGYTDAARNSDAFVDLPVGPDGQSVRHFRTRDLARWRPDGSLEYCGRADGFAKVGGKWMDLLAVERSLMAAGCREAALVWDERAKARHAAVVLGGTPDAPASESLAAQAAKLQRLLPSDTRLHLLPELPHNEVTGKVHRGALIKRVATMVPKPQVSEPGVSHAVARVQRSLLWGLLLAARAGARGALVLPLAWQLAPALLGSGRGRPGLLALALPRGVAWSAVRWASCYKALGHCLRPAQLAALPYVFLLLLDAAGTGLEDFARAAQGPVGALGLALLLCRRAPPWMRSLLASAGAVRARQARGGPGWCWAFWLGLPTLYRHWVGERYSWPEDEAKTVLQVLRRLLDSSERAEDGRRTWHELHHCAKCWEWAAAGTTWRERFYCAQCSEGWEPYQNGWQVEDKESSGAKSNDNTPTNTPRASPKSWGGSSNGFNSWTPGLDVVDFKDYEVDVARRRSRSPARKPCSGNGRGNGSEPATPVARIVERCTGVNADSPSASLASLESLKVITLVSALRRELGLDLANVDVARCETLGELESLCAAAPPVSAPGAASVAKSPEGTAPTQCGLDADGNETWCVYTIPRFWKAPVGWLLRLDEMPDEAAMRAACRALVRRHAGLRAERYRTSGDEAMANICNGAAPIVTVLGSIFDSAGPRGCCQGLLERAAQGLLAAWPHITCTPAEVAVSPVAMHGKDVAHFEWHTFKTDDDLRRAAWLRARTRGFKQPASIAVLVLDASTAGNSDPKPPPPQAYIHVAVNHAVTDAASIVPLVSDLLALHRAARQVLAEGRLPADQVDAVALAALAAAALAPAPHGLEVQRARLRASLLPSSTPAAGVASALDWAHAAFPSPRDGYDHYVRLMGGACRLLEVAAGVIGSPTDHLIVTAIAAAFGKITSQSEVKLSLIVPMRDARGEGQVVGNLATTRHFTLWVGGGRSLAAIALDLSARLRRREWALCDVLGDDCDRLFINVRGMPTFEGAAPVIEKVDTTRKPTHMVKNAVEMFVDQESAESWAIWAGVRSELDGKALGQAIRHALWCLAANPLQPMVDQAAA